MGITKEIWEMSEPVNPTEQKEYRDFTKDRNDYPRFDDENDEYEYRREMEEIQFEEQMNAYWEDRYGM